MKVTVTGAGGYIGSVLVPMLLEAGHEVTALDRFFFGETLAPHPRLDPSPPRQPLHHRGRPRGRRALIDLVAISNDPSGEEFRNETLAINWRARAHPRRAGQGGRGQALHPALLLLDLRLPGRGGGRRRDLAHQPAHHLRDGQREGRARTCWPLADGELHRGGAAPGHGLRPLPAHALRPRDQRHDLGRLQDRQAALDARRQPVAADGAREGHRRGADLHARRPGGEGERPDLQRRLGGQRLPARAARRDRRRRGAARGRDRVLRRRRPPLLPGRLRQDRGARLARARETAADGVREILRRDRRRAREGRAHHHARLVPPSRGAARPGGGLELHGGMLRL